MNEDGWKFHLAALIGKSISEIEEMPHEELILWRFYLSEPRGDARSDYHAAQITQAIYTIAQSFSKNSKKIKMEDCLLKFESPETNKVKQIEKYKLMAKAWSELSNKKRQKKIDNMTKLNKKER